MQAADERKWKSKDDDVPNHIQERCGLVEDVDILDAAAQLEWFGPPVVRDWVALKDGHKESADPPTKHVDRDGEDCDLEATCGKEADVKGKYGRLNDGHGTGMEDLHCVHNLALRQ